MNKILNVSLLIFLLVLINSSFAKSTTNVVSGFTVITKEGEEYNPHNPQAIDDFKKDDLYKVHVKLIENSEDTLISRELQMDWYKLINPKETFKDWKPHTKAASKESLTGFSKDKNFSLKGLVLADGVSSDFKSYILKTNINGKDWRLYIERREIQGKEKLEVSLDANPLKGSQGSLFESELFDVKINKELIKVARHSIKFIWKFDNKLSNADVAIINKIKSYYEEDGYKVFYDYKDEGPTGIKKQELSSELSYIALDQREILFKMFKGVAALSDKYEGLDQEPNDYFAFFNNEDKIIAVIAIVPFYPEDSDGCAVAVFKTVNFNEKDYWIIADECF